MADLGIHMPYDASWAMVGMRSNRLAAAWAHTRRRALSNRPGALCFVASKRPMASLIKTTSGLDELEGVCASISSGVAFRIPECLRSCESFRDWKAVKRRGIDGVRK